MGCGVAALTSGWQRMQKSVQKRGSGFAGEALGSPALPRALQAAVRRLDGCS